MVRELVGECAGLDRREPVEVVEVTSIGTVAPPLDDIQYALVAGLDREDGVKERQLGSGSV